MRKTSSRPSAYRFRKGPCMATFGQAAADYSRLCHVGATQNRPSLGLGRRAVGDARSRKTTALCRSSGRLKHTDGIGRRCLEDKDGSRRSLLASQFCG